MRMKEDFERYLGVDFGLKRIGIAVSDPLQIFAYPLITIANDKSFWDNFEKTIRSYNLKAIILGYPLRENGEKSETTLLVEKFESTLNKKFNIPVFRVDERYTSGIAQDIIIQSVVSKKKRQDKGRIDKTAASIILQDFLDSKKDN